MKCISKHYEIQKKFTREKLVPTPFSLFGFFSPPPLFSFSTFFFLIKSWMKPFNPLCPGGGPYGPLARFLVITLTIFIQLTQLIALNKDFVVAYLKIYHFLVSMASTVCYGPQSQGHSKILSFKKSLFAHISFHPGKYGKFFVSNDTPMNWGGSKPSLEP